MKKWCLRIFIWRYKGICLLYSPHMWRALPTAMGWKNIKLRILHTCGERYSPGTDRKIADNRQYNGIHR